MDNADLYDIYLILVLTDNHGRPINYLRLAVTDRCNLRCFYCMPEGGLQWLPRRELLSFEELLRLCAVLVRMGICKIRITGGEPFVRKDLPRFLAQLAPLTGLEELTITTNGILTAPLVPQLKALGIRSVNLSLDTLDRDRFRSITRRDELPRVLETLDTLLQHGLEVKLNAVVMAGRNTEDIIPLASLSRELPVSVRFIEEMPFNGTAGQEPDHYWDHLRILDVLRQSFPHLQALPVAPSATAALYSVPGHRGTIGIIAAWSRTFCGTCNRIRLTPEGVLKTCLYEGGGLNIRDLMRSDATDEMLEAALTGAFNRKARDGREAARRAGEATYASMATIGG